MRLNFTSKLPLLIGVADNMYGDKILSDTHCGNNFRKTPLAPVMIVARRAPDVATTMISSQAWSTVCWCKSSVTCAGAAPTGAGIRRDSCNSDRTRRRVTVSSGTNVVPAIFAISSSVNCFIAIAIIIQQHGLFIKKMADPR